MYIKKLSIAFFGLTSTLVAKTDPNSIDEKHHEDAKCDNYKEIHEDAKCDNYREIFHKLCPIISQFPGLRDLEEFRIRNEITDKSLEVIREETRMIGNKPNSSHGYNVAREIEEYTKVIRILLESLNKKESTTIVLEAINVCDQFRRKAMSEWNEPKGTVTQEEFKKELEKIYEKYKTEIESQKQEYRDIKALLSNEKEKTGQQISSIEQDKIGQLRQLQKEREKVLNSASPKLSEADMLILKSFLEGIKKNEENKLDLLFLESKRVDEELRLKSEINKTKELIEDAELRYREKEINNSQKEKNRLEANKKIQEEESERQRRKEESERQRRKEESERQRRKEEGEKEFKIQIKEPRNSGFFYWLFSLFSSLIGR